LTAGYSLARYKVLLMFLYPILFATCLPLSAMMVPVYGLFVRLQLVDSLTGATLFLVATLLPTAIWMTKNFIDGVPLGLEEAARTDGASQLQRLRHIVLPLTLPGIMVVAIVTFIATWATSSCRLPCCWTWTSNRHPSRSHLQTREPRRLAVIHPRQLH
jgi:multiple sugar transport system permease protein